MGTNVTPLAAKTKDAPSKLSGSWVLAGVFVFGLLLLVMWLFHRDPVQERALKAGRLAAVGRMRIALVSAEEAEKSSVLAITDEESERFADEARKALSEVEAARARVTELLAAGSPDEKDLLERFDSEFARMRPIADEVLRLAVKNTNLKAYAMTFGPAADTLADFDAALAHVGNQGSTPDDVRRAYEARLGLQRIQALLPPHIAETSDAKMDRLEERMSRDEELVRSSLAELRGKHATDPDLARADADLARYGEYKKNILFLSRENTNVRSLDLSLHDLRKSMLACVDALARLERAVELESIPGEGKLPALPR